MNRFINRFGTNKRFLYSPLKSIQDNYNPVMTNFGKFDLPLKFKNYNSKDITINTRKDKCTLFDVSHMAIFEIGFKEKNYQNLSNVLESLFPINTNILKENRSALSIILNKECEIIDDFIVSNIDNEKYRFVINANTKEDFEKLMKKKLFSNCDQSFKLENPNKIILAIQGKKSQEILEEIYSINLNDLYFLDNLTLKKNEIEISRCGYTGEDGFELYLSLEEGYLLYKKLVHKNLYLGGLLERDILRLESGLCLSGSEFSKNQSIHFSESNLDFVIGKKRKNDKLFIGGEKLNNFINNKKSRVGFMSKKPLRTGKIYHDYKYIGEITSSVKSYNLDKFIGMGYIYDKYLDYDLNLYTPYNKEINLTKLPFIKPNYRVKSKLI